MKKVEDTLTAGTEVIDVGQHSHNASVYYVPRFVFVVLLATVFSWVLGQDNYKYHFHSQIGFENGFPGDLDNWTRAGDWANVDFTENGISVNRSTPNKSYAKYEVQIPSDAQEKGLDLKVNGTVDIDLIEDQAESYKDDDGGSLMVWYRDATGEIIKYANVQEFNLNQANYSATKILAIPDAANSFEIVLNSRDSLNSMSLIDASIEMLQQTKLYKLGLTALLALWLLIGFLGIRWLIQYGDTRLTLTLAALVVAIFIGVLLPEKFMSNQIDRRLINYFEISPSSRDGILEIVYKGGHFLFFFLVSLVVVINSHKLSIQHLSAVTLLVLLAVATEGMQLHLLGRTTRLLDLGVDVTGIVLAASLAYILSRLKQRKTKQ